MPISDLLAQITGESNSSPVTPTSAINLPKRKADDGLRRAADKMPRSKGVISNSSRPISQPSTLDSMAKIKIGADSRKPSSQSSDVCTVTNGRPAPPPSTDAPKVPPKKGSYAEIMARGKAAQATLGQIGKIQHKKIEKAPSKREREDMRNQKAQRIQKVIAPNGKFAKAGQAVLREGLNGRRENGNPSQPMPEKKVKKAALATTGYAGTARPNPGSSKAGSRSSNFVSSRSNSRYDESRGSSSRYTYVSEEEDEEEDQEYDSDMSSDMEAAAFEVDEEEELAAKIARKEDAEALAEENRLKREKEEKKRRLAALARSRR
ncbi:hypothetical protein B7494_g8325 [Chlorociboria aeruginascens]|nr:hypothetical protein B7494_g8325 [Chlorociboria aeruginascens]